MSVGSADIQKAIMAAWSAASLDDLFTDLGGDTPSLNYDEASPEHGQPYAVWNFMAADIETRMTGGTATGNEELRSGNLKFDVHTKPVSGDARGASQIAAYLIEEIMKVFGGHPTENPTAETDLDNGCILDFTYMRDYCVRTGNNNYQWTLEYEVLVDVPVAI